MHYLVCYDIRNKKRLANVHKTLLKSGIPLQYSVFYVNADIEIFDELVIKLKQHIDPKQDDLRLYKIASFDISKWKKADASPLTKGLLII